MPRRSKSVVTIGQAAGAVALALAAVATSTTTGGARTMDVSPVAQVSIVESTPAPVALPVAIVPPAPVYADNLDGWIRQAMDILRAHNIPASYDAIMRNIMRESTGNPRAINLYDSNAAAGIPSKGLLQVIDPTFAAYHVEGTSTDIYDPVANIVAACNYAAHRYGSMDNVNSAY
ncbi:transglycosylase SLT domain-containing protein [Antrihabitans sp. YC2-6]|nr:transglycosylase SLT domain-containing protein [Antrihabitans sp. YC2-6]